MNKKFLIVLVVIFVLLATLCGCNVAVGPGNYNFKICHISDASGNCCDVNIKTWHDTEGSGIEINTEDGNSIFLSEGTYILFENECEICK